MNTNKRGYVDEDINDNEELVKKYAHGSFKSNTKQLKHKALKKTLEEVNSTIRKSASLTANTEILLPDEPGFIQVDEGDKIYKISQSTIKQNVDMNTATNIFDFQLTKFGPYNVSFSRNGRNLLFAGKRGHVATLDCLRTTVGTELQLQEDVHDACFLHNDTMFAVAQKKYTYIYDQNGVELHCLRKHDNPYKLDFLPYHYLLTSVGQSGWIKWHDISTGTYITGSSSGHGPCRVLKHNPQNAVSLLGHSNGVVTMWSPASNKCLVSLFCHKSQVTDVAVDREGRYLATAGLDGLLKIWDVRKYQVVHVYKPDAPVRSIDISDRGLIALGISRTVQVLKNAFTQPMDVTYLKHSVRTPNRSLCGGTGAVAGVQALLSSVSVSSVKFRPYEDSLCLGHSHGITSIVVPGSGEPNFDSFENNPFITTQQRREQEVQTLLTKLSPDMIALDTKFIGSVDKDEKALSKEMDETFYNANKEVVKKKDKHKMRGRSKIGSKLRAKQKNVIEEYKEKERQQVSEAFTEKQKSEKKIKRGKEGTDKSKSAPLDEEIFNPLARFGTANK